MDNPTIAVCTDLKSIDLGDHWDTAYKNGTTDKLGWYESYPELTLKLIEQCELSRDAVIFNPGAGSTILIDELLKLGYQHLIANDISTVSLKKLKLRLSPIDQEKVQFIVDDLTKPESLLNMPQVDLWNDRAVLHFFREDHEQKAYFDLLRKVVKCGGFVLIAAFSTDGALKCCGLDVQRYNTELIQEKLGSQFELIQSCQHVFINPNGDERPYIYTLFKRNKA